MEYEYEGTVPQAFANHTCGTDNPCGDDKAEEMTYGNMHTTLMLISWLVIIPLLIIVPPLIVLFISWASSTDSPAPSSEPAAAPEDSTDSLQSESTVSFGSAQSTLEAAERDAKRLRSRVTRYIVFIAWAFKVVGVAPFILHFVFLASNYDTVHERFVLTIGFACWGAFTMLLILRPTDAARIQNSVRVYFVACLFSGALLSGIAFGAFMPEPTADADVQGYSIGLEALPFIGFLSGAVSLVGAAVALTPAVFDWSRSGLRCRPSKMPPRRQLQLVWLVSRTGVLLLAIVFTGFAIATGIGLAALSAWQVIDNCAFALLSYGCFFFFNRTTRGACHRFLSGLGRSGHRQQEAAAVASLIGEGASVSSGSGCCRAKGSRRRTSVALATAQRNFRAIPAKALTKQELMDNKLPIPQEKTRSAVLGEVHAFMSHSWSDDGEAKHAQLNAYAEATGYGEHCLIWLDKAYERRD